MVKFVNAKLNLGLNIVRKREDGYHDLETLFYPAGLNNGTPINPQPFNDILEIHLRGDGRGDEFSFYGNRIDCPPEKNLAARAVEAFREGAAKKGTALPGVTLELEKHIPDGAGLGGGSADASFTLTALNELCGEIFSRKELMEMSGKLGADCPFFIENRPVLAKGTGDIFTPSELDLGGYWAVIVKPPVYVSTKEAFAGITPRVPDKPIEEIVKEPVDRWEEAGLRNDFESSIFRLHPLLGEIKESLKASGALYAAMSGSGSSLFGIFADEAKANEAMRFYPADCKSFLCLL